MENQVIGISKLAEALSKAQAMFQVPKKTKTNPHFKTKYADLSDVIDATKDGLSKNDLSITQGVVGTNLKTILMHKSGEFIESLTPLMLDKQTMQGLGSALTYARRYALSALLNVASDEDDDGNAASKQQPQTKPKPPSDLEKETMKVGKYTGKTMVEVLCIDSAADFVLAKWVSTECENDASKMHKCYKDYLAYARSEGFDG